MGEAEAALQSANKATVAAEQFAQMIARLLGQPATAGIHRTVEERRRRPDFPQGWPEVVATASDRLTSVAQVSPNPKKGKRADAQKEGSTTRTTGRATGIRHGVSEGLRSHNAA